MEEKTTEIKDCGHVNETMRVFIVPDGVTTIGKEAFRSCYSLKKVYIPRSVETIKNGAFDKCPDVEIYCEDEPKEGWVYGMRKETVRYEIVTPEDDAFNFHRSGGSFTSTTVEREVESFHNWNPLGRPVHTHVDKRVIEEWES